MEFKRKTIDMDNLWATLHFPFRMAQIEVNQDISKGQNFSEKSKDPRFVAAVKEIKEVLKGNTNISFRITKTEYEIIYESETNDDWLLGKDGFESLEEAETVEKTLPKKDGYSKRVSKVNYYSIYDGDDEALDVLFPTKFKAFLAAFTLYKFPAVQEYFDCVGALAMLNRYPNLKDESVVKIS